MRGVAVLKFAGASGAGLILDFAVYTALNEAGLRAGVANLVSAACGVTLVFLLSAHRIFEGAGDRFLGRLFAAYAGYQVVAIALASLAVDGVTSLLDGAYLAGKLAVLPFTFAANYAFTSRLLSPRRPARP